MANKFRFKDQFPSSICSHFVYYFKCGFCNESYVGLSERHRKVRFSEHMGRSARSGKIIPSCSVAITSISNHTLCTGHVVNDENCKIIATGSTFV